MFSLSHNLLGIFLDLLNVIPQLLRLCNPCVDIGGGVFAALFDTSLYRHKLVEEIEGFQKRRETLTSSRASSMRLKTVGNAEGVRSLEMTSSLSGKAPLPTELSTASAYSRCEICDGMGAGVKSFRS